MKTKFKKVQESNVAGTSTGFSFEHSFGRMKFMAQKKKGIERDNSGVDVFCEVLFVCFLFFKVSVNVKRLRSARQIHLSW